MSEIFRSIARNTSVMALQYVITMTAGIVFLLFLPRYLGPDEYGRFYLAVSITQVFQILVNYGSNYLIAKKISREPEKTGEVFANAIVFRLMLAIASIFAIAGINMALGYTLPVRMIIAVFSAGLVLWAVTSSYFALFQGHEQMKYTSIAAVAERVFIVGVSVFLLILGTNALGIAIVVFVGGCLNVYLLYRFSHRFIHSMPRVNWRDIAMEAKAGLPYFLYGVFSTLYYRIGTVMLSKMTSEAMVGYYGGAHRIFETLNNFPFFLSIAVYPVMSKLWHRGDDSFRTTMQRSIEWVLFLGIPVSVCVIYFSSDIVEFFYGLENYHESVIVLQILAVGLILLYVDMVLGTSVMSSDNQKKMMLIAMVAIPVNVGLNFLLIPYFQSEYGNGAMGTAIAIGLTEVGVMTSLLQLVPRGTVAGLRFRNMAKSLVGGGLLVVFLLLTEGLGIPWMVRGVFAMALFVLLAWVMKMLDPEEIDLIKQYARKGLRKVSALWSRGGGAS